MIRGTRRPGGAGRTRGGRSGGAKGGKGGGGKSEKPGCWLFVIGSLLMLGSGLSLIALKLLA